SAEGVAQPSAAPSTAGTPSSPLTLHLDAGSVPCPVQEGNHLRPGLVAFLGDAAIPVDNNATERALRGIALGRKNHYGSRSERGTRVAALCYTLLESAKLAGVEPAAYLADATRRAIARPGTVTLPCDLRAA